jgi:hypothetical protein
MDHQGIVMQLVRRGSSGADALVPVTFFSAGKLTLTAFEICLRACTSFREKLRQLLGKSSAKRRPRNRRAPFSKFHIRRICGGF